MTNDQGEAADSCVSASNELQPRKFVMDLEKVEHLRGLHSKMAETLTSKQRLTAKVETMQRARLAAHADAAAARDRWR